MPNPIVDQSNFMRFIDSAPGVCGGDARIKGTRLSVWVLESGRRLGVTPERQLERYPFISVVELEAAYRYAAENRDEIDRLIRENDED